MLSTTLKINRETLEKLRKQNPGESFNEIMSWALFELEYIDNQAKKLNLSREQIREANIFINFISKLSGGKILTFTEVLKSKDVKVEDALISVEEDL